MRGCRLLALVLCIGVRAADAQDPPAANEPTPPAVQFMPRAELRLSAERLSGDDPRFVWDTQFGGEVDFLDYGRGRLSGVANYQAMLGERFRAFDPEQGNYMLEMSTSARLAGVELSGVFYHQSRHLSDRAKRFAVDWNMVGGRVERVWTPGRRRVAARADLRRTIMHSYVDYTWELDTHVRAEAAMTSHVLAFGAGGVRFLAVDGTRNRGTQSGFRTEGGVRLTGKAGATELFLAVERRIDPYQLEFSTMRWAAVGFRILSR